jgi:hypothetical protein
MRCGRRDWSGRASSRTHLARWRRGDRGRGLVAAREPTWMDSPGGANEVSRRSRPRHPGAAGRSWRFPDRTYGLGGRGSLRRTVVRCVPGLAAQRQPDFASAAGAWSRVSFALDADEACSVTVPPVAASRLSSAKRVLPSGPTLAQACRVGIDGARVAGTGGHGQREDAHAAVERLDGQRAAGQRDTA